MKRYNALFFCAFISVIICFSACTNTTSIGSDLLESDRQDLQFSEDFVMQTSTILGDSVLTFNPVLSSQLTDYLVGEYQDPIFGKVRSSVYAQVSTGVTGKPDFVGNTLDSVVLVLPYRTSSEYGSVDTEYSIDILRIDDASRFDAASNPYAESIWSVETFMTQSTPLATKSFIPNTTDTIMILNPKQDSLGFNETEVAPQLRILMDMDFSMELFNADVGLDDPDESVFFTDDQFTAFFNGIHINPTSENEGLLDFGLRSNSDAGIFVYYTVPATVDGSDSLSRSYQFPFAIGDIKHSNYSLDYTGSMVETFLNQPSMGDSLFFLQGLSGVNGNLKFPDLDNLRNNATINKAELILSVAELPEDSDIYELPSNIFLAEIKADGELEIIEDAFNVNSSGGDITEYTDRSPTYTINVTAHLQNILKGNATENLALVVLGREQSATRAVFYGGGHSTYPVKLRVYYTQF